MQYPSIDQYFARLPDGWRSFPECTASAQLLETLRDRGALDGLEDLPEPVAQIVHGTLPASGWVHEVVHVAAVLAVRDARFAGPDAELPYIQWVESLNRDLFNDPQFARTFAQQIPLETVRAFAGLWETFHRGTTIDVESMGAGRARVLVHHPAHLFPAISIETRRRTLGAALARAGAVQPEVVTEPDARGTVFSLAWRHEPPAKRRG